MKLSKADFLASLRQYADLLGWQYRQDILNKSTGQYQSSKAVKTIEILSKQGSADFINLDLMDAFDMDNAIGKQQEILDKYIGSSRNTFVEYDPQNFCFTAYDRSAFDPPLPDEPPAFSGFTTYVDIQSQDYNNLGRFMSYKSVTGTAGKSQPISDDALRIVQKLKIIQNSGTGRFSNIMLQIKNLFGNFIMVEDTQQMKLIYYVKENFPLSNLMLEKYLPKPMGVGIEVIRVS